MSAKKKDEQIPESNQNDTASKNLGQMLLDASLVTQQQLDYAYELQRRHKADADSSASEKRKRELEIMETEQEKQAQWIERERAIKDHQEELEALRAQADALPRQLQEAIQQAGGEAAQEATREAQIKTDLLQKEIEANRRVRELKIQTLEETIVKQAEQIFGEV